MSAPAANLAPILALTCLPSIIFISSFDGVDEFSVLISGATLSCHQGQKVIDFHFGEATRNRYPINDFSVTYVANNTEFENEMICSSRNESLEYALLDANPTFQTSLHLVLHIISSSTAATSSSFGTSIDISCVRKHNNGPTHAGPAFLPPPPNESWLFDPQRWRKTYMTFYEHLALAANHLNTNPPATTPGPPSDPAAAPFPPGPDGAAGSTPGGAAAGPPDPLDFPIFVMNLESRGDRRAHMEGLLSGMGFTRVMFPPTTTLAAAADVDELIGAGYVDEEARAAILARADKGGGALGAYVANALDQMEALRVGVDNGWPLFAVMEDDLMLIGNPQQAREALALAIGQLPPTADMLYLEYCYEKCSRVTYSSERPNLMRAHYPYCAAATVFTAKGARNVLETCLPIFDGVDDMYPTLILNGHLEAYVSEPPIMIQDGYWGSNANRSTNLPYQVQDVQRRVHVPFAPTCFEHNLTHLLLDLRQIGRVMTRDQLLASEVSDDLIEEAQLIETQEGPALEDTKFIVLLFADSHTRRPRRNAPAAPADPSQGGGGDGPSEDDAGGGDRPHALLFYTRRFDSDDYDMLVGRWTGPECGVVLALRVESECWHDPAFRLGHPSVFLPDPPTSAHASNWCTIQVVTEDHEGVVAAVEERIIFLHTEADGRSPVGPTHLPCPA